jgi:hypothetical protein
MRTPSCPAAILLLHFLLLAADAGAAVEIELRADLPPARFARDEIRQALAACPAVPNAWRIVFDPPSAALGPQAYAVSVLPGEVVIAGGDPSGLLYGGLEVAEAIRHGGGPTAIRPAAGRPAIAARGIKFNIPLDARTPSYSDGGDAARVALTEVWSLEFWREFLDEMARHRFNTLTLWNYHPFPSLVAVPEYPEVALDDVMRSRIPLDCNAGGMGRELIDARHFTDLETVRILPMAEKIRFWREVMQLAADRGIAVYWFTWNLYAYGAAGKHGITHDQDNPVTLDYYRASVRALIRTYPLLAGIGITAGERMQPRDDDFAPERWLYRAYGEGVNDALRAEPGRPFRVIHRFHDTKLDPILAEWSGLECPLEMSYKYSVARMYSHHAPPFIHEVLSRLPPGQRTWLTVRNDDIYSFRWGDPAYARAYLRAMPDAGRLAGFYIGSDGDTWGRDVFSTDPGDPPPVHLRKHWYAFMIWGRLAYDPDLEDGRFTAALAARFPGIDAARLAAAMASAGAIIPQLNRFYWNDIDLKWLPETCQSHPTFRWSVRGFHTVAHFAQGQAMPGAGVLSISQHVAALHDGRPAAGMTPPQVAEALRGHADQALELLAGLGDPAGLPLELRLTIGDQVAMAHLGRYYADKIEAATALALFSRTRDETLRDQAIARLESALGHWRAYVAVATRQYRPRLLARSMPWDPAAVTPRVEADIDLARGWAGGRR